MTESYFEVYAGDANIGVDVPLATIRNLENPYIHEEINAQYTFKTSYYPQSGWEEVHSNRIIFVDGDYFRIRKQSKNRSTSKRVDLDCEHVSYELNDNPVVPEEEIVYEGKIWEIMDEILDGTRFTNVHIIADYNDYTFATKTAGKRSRIIEFCNQFGFEVNFNKFNVYVQTRRGADNGLVLEVGKNIIDMTESYELDDFGNPTYSYEVGFVDLSHVKDLDDNPIEEYEAHLGDTVHILDAGFLIDVKPRCVSVGYNPFNKALPKIELGHSVKGISNSVAEIAKPNQWKPTPPSPSGPQVIYGVKIDETNSNPGTALTYTDDAVGFTPAYMDFASDTFNYGSWENKFPFNQIKPCLFKDGAVVGYLNPNNYAQFEDGSPADITSGVAGDVMVELPKIWWKFERIGTDLYVRFASYAVDETFKCLAHTRGVVEVDKIYIGVFLGFKNLDNRTKSLSGVTPTTDQSIGIFRNQAQANGQNYEQIAYYQLLMLQTLFIVMFKSRNSQEVLGAGYVTSNLTFRQTGGTIAKGLFYGESTGKHQMKFCGIEDFYGNYRYFVDGICVNSSKKILISTGSFNNTGTNYADCGDLSLLNTQVGGHVKKVKGGTQTGFISIELDASSTTYYCDYVDHLQASDFRFITFGGSLIDGFWAGIFSMPFGSSANGSSNARTSRLMYL